MIPDDPLEDIGISDEQVTRLLDSLDDAETPVSGSERRSSRSYLRGTAVVAFASEADTLRTAYRVRLRNLSRDGVAFLICSPLATGVEVTLELPVGPGLSLVKRRAIVQRCREVEGPIHEIGVEFLTEIPRGS